MTVTTKNRNRNLYVRLYLVAFLLWRLSFCRKCGFFASIRFCKVFSLFGEFLFVLHFNPNEDYFYFVLSSQITSSNAIEHLAKRRRAQYLASC